MNADKAIGIAHHLGLEFRFGHHTGRVFTAFFFFGRLGNAGELNNQQPRKYNREYYKGISFDYIVLLFDLGLIFSVRNLSEAPFYKVESLPIRFSHKPSLLQMQGLRNACLLSRGKR